MLDGTGGAAQSPPTTPTAAPASKSVPALLPVPAPASAALASPAAAALPAAIRQEEAPAAAPKQGSGAVAVPMNDAAKPAQAPAHSAPASEPMATAVNPAQLKVPTPTASKGEPAPTAEKPTQPQASGPAPASREPTTAVPTPTVQPARAEIPAAGPQPQTSGPTPSSGEPAPTAGTQPTGPTLGPGRGGADSGQRLAVFEDRAPPARRPVPGTTPAGANSTHAVLTLPPGRGPVSIPGVTSPSKPAPLSGGQARGAGAAAAGRGGLGCHHALLPLSPALQTLAPAANWLGLPAACWRRCAAGLHTGLPCCPSAACQLPRGAKARPSVRLLGDPHSSGLGQQIVASCTVLCCHMQGWEMCRSRLRVLRGTVLMMGTGAPSASGCRVSRISCHVESPACSTALGQKYYCTELWVVTQTLTRV